MAETKTRGGKRAIRYAPAALALSVAVLLAPTLAHAAGQLDPSFGNGGRVMTDFGNPYNGATSVAMDSQGRIVAAGQARTGPSQADFALTRYVGFP
jgi:hypothetical protein